MLVLKSISPYKYRSFPDSSTCVDGHCARHPGSILLFSKELSPCHPIPTIEHPLLKIYLTAPCPFLHSLVVAHNMIRHYRAAIIEVFPNDTQHWLRPRRDTEFVLEADVDSIDFAQLMPWKKILPVVWLDTLELVHNTR